MHVSRLCQLTREIFDPGADHPHERSGRQGRYVLLHFLGLAEQDCGLAAI